MLSTGFIFLSFFRILSNPDLLKHLQGLSQQTNVTAVEMPSVLQASMPSGLLGDRDMRDPAVLAAVSQLSTVQRVVLSFSNGIVDFEENYR